MRPPMDLVVGWLVRRWRAAYPALGLDGEDRFEQADELCVLRVENELILHALALQRHGREAEALPCKQPVQGTCAVVTEQRGLDLVLEQPRLVARRGVASIGHADAHQRVLAAFQEAALQIQRHCGVLACCVLALTRGRVCSPKVQPLAWV